VLRGVIAISVFVLLTLLTQIGGLVLLLAWLVSRLTFPKALAGWRRIVTSAGLFAALYAGISVLAVPPLAALGGRVPLPCRPGPDRPFGAGNIAYCVLNRHYVAPELLSLVTELSREMDRTFPGTVTLFLDGNFPFLNGFPLLPHLSHTDGRKLDLAFHYSDAEGFYLPSMMRSPIGYWAFEQPAPQDSSPCGRESWLSLRWNLVALQDRFPNRPLESQRTSAALRWLVADGLRFKVDRIFIEPYLAARLGVSSPLLGFQGCRAARHDDHIHIQIKS
jgi:hypothetical protein